MMMRVRWKRCLKFVQGIWVIPCIHIRLHKFGNYARTTVRSQFRYTVSVGHETIPGLEL